MVKNVVLQTSDFLDVLLRIMDKARVYADSEDVSYEGLASVYEKAILREIAELTTPNPIEKR